VKDETAVVITLKGVRVERLDRLRTLVKSELARFGREWTVDDGQKKPPAPKPRLPFKKRRKEPDA
jgi:hypothetical protein